MRLDGNVTFVPADPPRASWFAVWDGMDQGGLLAETAVVDGDTEHFESVQLELAVPAKRGTSVEPITARKVPLATAIDVFATLPRSDPASRSSHAWAGVVRAALSFIADGRVLPWISPDGFDTWRVDPLSPTQLALVDACVQALPAEAHAIPLGARGTIADPEFLVRAVCDAVADSFCAPQLHTGLGRSPFSPIADPPGFRICVPGRTNLRPPIAPARD